MTFKQAMHWLVTRLREERELAVAAGGGWKRPAIVEAVREKYAGSDAWLQMQAAITSRAVEDKMMRILQRLGRHSALGSEGNVAELDGLQDALDGLELRASYVIDLDGSEQATELMTGNEARTAVYILQAQIKADEASLNRLQAALKRHPGWFGDRTLFEVIAAAPVSA